MAQSLEPFFGDIEAPMRGAGDLTPSARGLSLLEFLQGLDDYLVALAKQAIDTPEERAAIVAHVLAGYDTYVAPRLGPLMSRVFRKNLKTILDDVLAGLASA